jgi:hypothetical protein
LLGARNQWWELSTHQQLLITVAFTSVCWIATACLTPATDRKVLIEFYRKTRPAGPGWKEIRAEAGEANVAPADDIPRALLGWVAGCTLIWSLLFSIGNFLYGRNSTGWVLLGIGALAGTVLVRIVNRIWSAASGTK